MLYKKFITQLRGLAYILVGLFAIIIGAIVFNFYITAEAEKHHSLLNKLAYVSTTHSDFAMKYVLLPGESKDIKDVDKCQLGHFLAEHEPKAEELLYFNKVKISHAEFHKRLEPSTPEKLIYVASQQLISDLNEYIGFQEAKMRQIEKTRLSVLLAILFVSLLAWLLFSFVFIRFILFVRRGVVTPLADSIQILRKHKVAITEEEEPKAVLKAVERVSNILTVDKVRREIYPFWNSTFEEEELLNGSLKYLGDSGQIVSGAFYKYDSFADLLTLQASYAFPENGKRVVGYGEGPIGEAAAQDKIITLTTPDMEIDVGIGSIKPSLVGCYPVCTQKMYGVLVLAFQANISEELLNAMQMFSTQLGFVLDRVRQLFDLKKMAGELQEKSDQLKMELNHKKSILQNSADGIVILTPQGVITSFSKGAEYITGYTAREAIGRDCCNVLKHHSQEFDGMCHSVFCGLCQVANTKQAIIGKELYLVNKKGDYVPILISATPIFNDQGEIVEILQIFKDLTEIKNNLTKLEHASRSKTEFLATMSHELRTPLNAILGFAELLEAESFGQLNEKQMRFAGNILTAGKHLLSLINDILDITRVEAGKMEWEQELMDLPTVFTSAVNLLREKAAQNGVKIHLEIQPEIKKFVGDERKLKQILYNLLANAVKFTPQGGQVGIRVKQIGDELHVDVWDTGIGIPKDKWQAVFEPFYQVDSYLTRKHQGSGLGLALVKNMIELAGGKIWLEEEPGKNTVFKFVINEKGSAAISKLEEEQQPEQVLVAKSEKVCVLIEDDKKTAELLETYLVELGFKVYMTASGTEGLKMVMEKLPDIVVLDILLPDTFGWEVLTKIKSTPVICAVPVLVISILDEKKKGLALGAKDYLVKPIEKQLLETCLERILCEKAAEYLALVIDDDPAALELMENYLLMANIKVIKAMSGEDGLKKALELKPDLIFLDLMLPEMDGFDFLRIKENEETITQLPVIVVTSKSLTSEERRFLEERVLYIARKSDFTKENFVSKVLGLLEKGDLQ